MDDEYYLEEDTSKQAASPKHSDPVPRPPSPFGMDVSEIAKNESLKQLTHQVDDRPHLDESPSNKPTFTTLKPTPVEELKAEPAEEEEEYYDEEEESHRKEDPMYGEFSRLLIQHMQVKNPNHGLQLEKAVPLCFAVSANIVQAVRGRRFTSLTQCFPGELYTFSDAQGQFLAVRLSSLFKQLGLNDEPVLAQALGTPTRLTVL